MHDLRVESGGQRKCDAGATATNALLSIVDVSELLNVSQRHIRRLTDAGRMPAPVRLGALLRWPARTGNPLTGIHDWIAAGCPDCRSLRRAVR